MNGRETIINKTLTNKGHVQKVKEIPDFRKTVIHRLTELKEDVIDLIEDFELINDPNFKKEVDEVLKASREGKTVIYTVEELAKELGVDYSEIQD